MATNSTSEAKAKVSLDSSQFVKSAKQISDAAKSMSDAVGAAFATAGVAILAAFGASTVSSIVHSLKGVIDLGEEMANAGHRAGIAAGQFYLFNKAVEKGLSLKTVAKLLGDNAEVLNRSASVFRDVGVKLWVVGEKIRGFWLGLMDRLSPVLSRLLDGALAHSLVSAGQAFGGAVADALEVVYQLASDGQLWGKIKEAFKIAFDYAGERMIWFAGLGYALLKESLTNSFYDSIASALDKGWALAKNWADSFGKKIGEGIFSFWTDIVEKLDGILNRIDKARNAVGLLSDKDLASNQKDRTQDVTAKRSAVDFKSPAQTIQSFAERFAEFVKGAQFQFKQSAGLSAEIAKFSEGLSGALSKYKSKDSSDPATSFENNSRRAAFGADSLASIGGGGNVYLGLSVLDVNRAQLQELKDISRKLDGGRSTGAYQSLYSDDDSYMSISRAQIYGVGTTN